ncbi:MAG: sortase [Candidatus Saccharibacteria bacterium]|nr:sortase [Candidatus Saccharibacteria bacterium]
MKPEEPKSNQGGMSLSQQGHQINAPTGHSAGPPKEAAAQLIRSQIDSIYDSQPTQSDTAPEPITDPIPLEDIDPYQRTHTEKPELQVNDWGQYHSAWQNYYQKYYEGYYLHHLNKKQPIKNENLPTPTSPKRLTSIRSRLRPAIHDTDQQKTTNTLTSDEAIFDMRQELKTKVHRSATKIKKSRHFLPIISGLIVVMIFIFLQYNSFIVSNVMAYVSPGNIDPQNIVIDPNADTTVGPEPKLIIPKINVDVPVIYDIGNDYNSQMAAMAKGVAQFAIPGANSHPGQVGNTVIAGHSSNDLFDGGDYKFIFAQLDKLNVGDTIYANYNSVRYTYIVTKKQVVSPNDVSSLVYPTTKPILTLLTCTPVGTALNRLLITAEQVSPDPDKSTAAPASSNTATKSIPGNTPSFIEKLFGAR